MNLTRLIFIATLISTLGFGVSLTSNVVDQTHLVKNLTFISVIFLGVSATVGWMWLVAKAQNIDTSGDIRK